MRFFTSLAYLAYDLEQLPPGARHIEKRKAAFSCDQHKTRWPVRGVFPLIGQLGL
ncbi:hypothetical protein WKH57_07970 [Niallia taxi]|uniref:hypothetical protein n=1 Tax=Niallia taxi TaxID=2499688 RepID=UPI00316D5489